MRAALSWAGVALLSALALALVVLAPPLTRWLLLGLVGLYLVGAVALAGAWAAQNIGNARRDSSPHQGE